MSRSIPFSKIAVCCAGVLLCLSALQPRLSAAVLLWDANTGTAGAQDGAGTWKNQDPAFNNWISGGSNVQWNNANADIATFGDNATLTGSFNVTVSGSVTAGGITFNKPNTGNAPTYSLIGGTISLTNGAIIHNAATTNATLHTISSALQTSGTVTITGRRFWMNNPSFSGGGTLNINTTDQLLFQNGGSLTGLSVINLNSGGIDIRGSIGGYNYASGTTMNVNANNLVLNTNSLTVPGTEVNWMGNIALGAGNTLALTPQSANTFLRISGVISESSGIGSIRVNANGTLPTTTVFTATNTYSGTTRISNGNLQVGVGGAGTTGTGIVTVETPLAGVTVTPTLSGTGTVRGATTVQSGTALKPGDSSGDGIGTLSFTHTTTNSLALLTGSNTYFTLAGATGNESTPTDGIQTPSLLTGLAGNHDHLDLAGGLILNTGSIINVALGTGYSPVWGDVFNLIDWGNVSGTLTPNGFNVATDLVLTTTPQMTANGWSWQTDQFASSGIIYVVPEPTRAVLLLGAFMAITMGRRRKR